MAAVGGVKTIRAMAAMGAMAAVGKIAAVEGVAIMGAMAATELLLSLSYDYYGKSAALAASEKPKGPHRIWC